MALRKPTVEALDGEVEKDLRNGAVLGKRPALAEFAVDGVYDDGTARVRPTLMVFVSDGQWQAWLHDREEARSAFVSGRTLDEALNALESGLSKGALCWRRDASPRKKS